MIEELIEAMAKLITKLKRKTEGHDRDCRCYSCVYLEATDYWHGEAEELLE